MPNWLPEEHLMQNDGKLDCVKCGNKLGDFKFSGLKCSCGEWVAPAYKIAKIKVDRK